jgi:hypothetical protein
MSQTVLNALGGKPCYRDGDDLYATDTGRHVGRFFGSDVVEPVEAPIQDVWNHEFIGEVRCSRVCRSF